MAGGDKKERGLDAAPAPRSSTRLAGRQRATSKSSLSDDEIDEIEPVPQKRSKRVRAKAAAKNAPTAKKKRVTRQSSREDEAAAATAHAKEKVEKMEDEEVAEVSSNANNAEKKNADGNISDAESILCSVPSLDTILSDEDDIADCNKYFRVKSRREVEAVATGIVRATTKPRVTRKMLEERKKAEAKMKVKPIPRHPILKLHYLPKHKTVPLFLNPNQLDADILEILGKTPGAFDIANKQEAAKAVAAKMAADEKAAQAKQAAAAKKVSKKASPAKKAPPKKASPKKGAVAKRAAAAAAAASKNPAARAKKSGKKSKSNNPAIDKLFRPNTEYKGYISCVSCDEMVWPPNREKHLPKCPVLHPELEQA